MDDVIKRLMVAGLFVMLGACSAPTAFQSTDRLTRGQTVHRILLMPVDVELSLLTAGGIQQPHAEWTAKAKAHIKPALRNVLKRHNVELIEYAAKGGGNDLAEQHVQLVKLHGAVGITILRHKYIENLLLPTKTDKFDWTLGPKAVALNDEYNADYALFLLVRDSYASAGRSMMVMAGFLLGVGVSGGAQLGFASLVDLHTGEIVWFNRLARAQGDLREAGPAEETVTTLLNNFPK